MRRLELRDVRSFESAALELGRGPTVLVGPNAQGKTNVLEALNRVATGSSHRVAGDGPLVRAGCELGVVRVRLRTDAGRDRSLEVELGTGRQTRVKVDGQRVRRAADAVGVLKVVLFAPEDVEIVRGGPAARRGFLDQLLAQRRPAYDAARRDYRRVVRQRNNLLKDAGGLSGSRREAAEATVRAWDEQLVEHAAGVLAARIAGVRALAEPTRRYYRWLADSPGEPVGLVYEAATGVCYDGSGGGGVPDRAGLAEELRAALAERAGEERRRGVTLVGPHRDELVLSIGELPAREYASQGEVWSLALALRLASHEVLGEVGDRPVVLLDDVFAELDDRRRGRLAEACEGFDQVVVTASVEHAVPVAGPRVEVRLEEGTTRLRPRAAGTGGDGRALTGVRDGGAGDGGVRGGGSGDG